MKRLFTAILLAPLFWACSDIDSAGATSETTNGIAITVVNASRTPIANARVTLYSKENLSVLGMSKSDTAGIAQFDTLVTNNVFVEGIAGEDSSLMAWAPLDTHQTEIPLFPSASLTVRTGAAQADYATLFEVLALDSTPYSALRSGGEYTFTHVPAGLFNVVAGDSFIATVELDTGSTADTLFRIPDVTREFVFEDFNDGDSLNNLAKVYPNYGWYFATVGRAKFTRPDSTTGFTGALENDANKNGTRGKYLSLRYELSDSSYVMLGTHLGLDTGYYDISRLTAIRIKARGDCKFYVALEHYKEIGDNTFRKALWKAEANKDWHEFVFRPGEEALRDESYQVHFSEIATEIGFFSVFIRSGTNLQIDDIVFEGINSIE